MSKDKIDLGDEVECKITGFRGIVRSLTVCLTGCDVAGVQGPMVLGKLGESYNFDIPALKVIKKGKVKPSEVQDPAPDKKGSAVGAPVLRKA